MTIDQTFTTVKIERINDSLGKAREILKMSDYDILHTPDKLAALERYFQLAIDAVIDINHQIIKDRDLEPPNDLQGTFTILGKNGILPIEFADKLAPAVGMRNRLVHQYEDVDPKIFVPKVRKDISDFDEYIRLILTYTKHVLSD